MPTSGRGDVQPLLKVLCLHRQYVDHLALKVMDSLLKRIIPSRELYKHLFSTKTVTSVMKYIGGFHWPDNIQIQSTDKHSHSIKQFIRLTPMNVTFDFQMLRGFLQLHL